MEKLQELKNKIIELVPEIKELKFGCRVLIDYNVILKVVLLDCPCIVIDTEKCLNSGKIKLQTFDYGYCLVDEKDIKKIIGRDITLEDVLIAIDKSNKDTDNHIFNEIMEIENDNFRVLDYIAWFGWKWGKSLDKQSEEVLNFLHEILC